MANLLAMRSVLETRPIDGADMIELTVVDGWKCVTKEDEYAAGDAVIYCEIDSFLPVREESEFLRKSSLKTMDEREGFRLRKVATSLYLRVSTRCLRPPKERACSIPKPNARGWSGFTVVATIVSRSKRSQTDSSPKVATSE
ncbi:hypothetical protein RB449 [Rhodopirellula baltica SH 1]|uniref:Uncharacterized protein n=1 Tax=Rhodopirellula baltica (strain DSM 10527 / NCIMB 13988 / SH1) TaxID=243090 RepID=Q7UYQ4_RHOBA|nr:hypothetical protein RB449 [Rhodopirellula baltica SH 1]